MRAQRVQLAAVRSMSSRLRAAARVAAALDALDVIPPTRPRPAPSARARATSTRSTPATRRPSTSPHPGIASEAQRGPLAIAVSDSAAADRAAPGRP